LAFEGACRVGPGVERESARLGIGISLGIPVTLNVGGFLVSGYVISGKDYFEEFSRIVQGGLPDFFSDEDKKNIVDSFRKLADQYEPEGATTEETVVQSRFNFVHLRNAVFLHPGGEPVPSNVGLLWRTKLDAVDGFTLGLLVALPDEPEPDDELVSGDESEPDE
jgi:hypothetical protein